MELYHYLPIYPEFDDELDQILENSKEKDEREEREEREERKDPYHSLYWKKEFYQNRLSVYEDKPKNPGQLLKHQIFISRFLSSHTPYNGLLLMHDPGTGKTCSSVGAIEQIRKEKTDFRRALVIMKSDKLIRNYIRELVFICTDGCYIPEGYYDDMTEETRRARIKKLYSEFYEFHTYETFSKELSSYSNQIIKKRYSNHIIVIDEVHNLRRRDNASQYKSIFRLLHTALNTKILLMSGTPMRDQSYEIADILNLILPLSNQMPTGKEFNKEYLESRYEEEEDEDNKDKENEENEENEEMEDDKKIYVVRNDPYTKSQLKSYFRGRISYLRSMKSDARKIFVDSSPPLRLEFFHLYRVDMSDHQSKSYKKAFKIDADDQNKKQSTFYSNSRQASLFVFPDGSYGNEGYQNYFQRDKNGKDKRSELDLSTVDKIKEYSCKYAECIQKILDHPDDCHFVFSNLVKGSGLLLFSRLLEIAGFSRATGKSSRPSPRYALFTGEESSAKEMNDIIEIFNNDNNYSGQYIRVILGSEVLAEGFTLKNIQHVHILTPSWNFSETDQVIARAFRLFSHDELQKQYPNQPINVRIYLYCAISDIKKKEDSVDYKMFSMCEHKDVSIKSVERIMKEMSIDCRLNDERNRDKNATDGSRECDYMSCDYQCEGDDKIEKDIDSSTYSLYYDQQEIDEIVEIIIDMFKKVYYYPFDVLAEIVMSKKKDTTLITISKAIQKIITTNIVIKDALDHNCFLRNQNDMLYITYNLKNDDSFFDNYYVNHFPLQQVNTNRQIHNLHIERFPSLFNKMIDSFVSKKATVETENLLSEFSDDAKEILIENAILLNRDKNRNKLTETAKLFVDFILNRYGPERKILRVTLEDGKEVDVSTFMKESRCLEPYPNLLWRGCTAEEENLIRSEKKVDIPQNEYGLAGLLKEGKFTILDLTTLEEEKKTKQSTGMACISFNKDKSIKIIHQLKLEMDDVENTELYQTLFSFTKKELINTINEAKKPAYHNITKAFPNLNPFSKDELVRMMYWVQQGKPEICERLKKWFIDHDLMYPK